MTETVYVVTCTVGEYEVRDSWIGGVFANHEQAICVADGMVSLSKAATVAHDTWVQRRNEIVSRIHGNPWNPISVEIGNIIVSEIGEPPETGDADDYYITEVSLNCWGHWNPLEDKGQ